MAGRVENINIQILKQCREQIGLDLFDVETKVKKIATIEEDEQKPTFRQLDILADFYKVPRWVFIADKLPDEYHFQKSVPAFRQFADNPYGIFDDYKIRGLTAKIEQYRELIIELREDMGEPIEPFNPPKFTKNMPPVNAARQIRRWLGTTDSFDFSEWKKMLEDKDVFVFLTSKYKGWSNIDRKLFRGLAIYNRTLPVIIINDSDARKAQSFSLFHELGHLIRTESAIDDWNYHNRKTEKWCDEFAGNVLLPIEQLPDLKQNDIDLDNVKDIAKKFKVSPYAYLVRLRQLRRISQNNYAGLEAQLEEEYKQFRKRLKESKGGPPRNKAKEILDQYGHIYAKTLFQSYHNKEIGLHKLLQLFESKRTSYVFEMESML